MYHITRVLDDYTEEYINSGVGINKNYIYQVSHMFTIIRWIKMLQIFLEDT